MKHRDLEKQKAHSEKSGHSSHGVNLLERLLRLLFPLRATEELVRNALPDHLAKLIAPTSFDAGGVITIALLPYREPLVHAVIVEAKFFSNGKAQELLGNVLAEYLLERLAEDARFTLGAAYLVPLPLSPARKKMRGYNQTEKICERAAARLGELVRMKPDALLRVRETLPQTTLNGSARRKNMRGAFTALPGIDTAHTYIVVDDVVTTGATLHGATSALRIRGASRILPIALAH